MICRLGREVAVGAAVFCNGLPEVVGLAGRGWFSGKLALVAYAGKLVIGKGLR